ncbi:hypothetical protein CEXT_606641 [Caerostris extrusa]|uniref:Uncharacterized protein n=1 Tax=Caerostris extrusa TaxID=172846 RepID=A0AAV4NPE2_CAEEX|nr:hypothetical protein CEXT_606641 [Caerostris extrusa]
MTCIPLTTAHQHRHLDWKLQKWLNPTCEEATSLELDDRYAIFDRSIAIFDRSIAIFDRSIAIFDSPINRGETLLWNFVD